MLDHPGMEFIADGVPEDPNTPAKKVCYDFDESLPATDPNYIVTDAVPGRRFVETAMGFAENGAVHSICAENYAPALNSILEKISQKLKGGCLPNKLNPNKDGIVECDVVEVLPKGQTGQQCNPQRGRQFIEMRNVGGEQRAVCKINQVAVVNDAFQPSPTALQGVAPLTGWFYDDFTDAALAECPTQTPQRISFVSGGTDFESAKPQGTTIRFECFQPVARSDSEARGKDAAGSPCTPAMNECQGRSDPQPLIDSGRGFGLTCDDLSNTCQIPCAVDANCPDSWVCQPSTTADKPGLCVNPTCPPPTLR
jgi:hypothetical protein